MMNKHILLLLAFLLFSNITQASESTSIRLGVLASGTLAWELAAMENENLLNDKNFTLKTVSIANQQAGKVALQSGSVDMIVSDWIWVSNMRSQGHDYTFYPYSASAGGLIVPADSNIKTLADLKGKKLGIAGGELDKNWALLQALAQKQQLDLNNSLEKVYGAPPLLNQQLSSGRIDALLTYWHFAARLEAQGYRLLMSGEDIVRELGIQETVPRLGYVFKQSWADQHKDALQQFLSTAQAAKAKLCDSEQAWSKIVKLTKTNDAATQNQIRNRYCQGRVSNWGKTQQTAAVQIFQLLQKTGNSKLADKNSELQTGTFWSAH